MYPQVLSYAILACGTNQSNLPDQDHSAFSLAGSPSNLSRVAEHVLGQRASVIKVAMPGQLRRTLWELWGKLVHDQECSGQGVENHGLQH